MSPRRIIPCLVIGVAVGMVVSFGATALRAALGQEALPDGTDVPIVWQSCTGQLRASPRGQTHTVLRTKVPSGWLIVVVSDTSTSSTYIPDSTHEWGKQ